MQRLSCTVLGSGTSAGVPAIGCRCDVCTSTDPKDRRLRTAAAVQWIDDGGQDRVLLIDAGPDLRQQVLAAGIDRCDGIFITHNHVDHVFGLDEVRRFNVTMQAPVHVWAEPTVQANLRRVYAHIFEPQDNINPSFVATIELHDLAPTEPIELHGLTITPIRLLHGALPILGFRLDAPGGAQPLPLAWCTDVSAIPEASMALLTGVDTLFLDMLRERPHRTHLNLEAATALAGTLGARQTWFVHMGHEVAHAATEAILPEGCGLAYDGLKLTDQKVAAAGENR